MGEWFLSRSTIVARHEVPGAEMQRGPVPGFCLAWLSAARKACPEGAIDLSPGF